MFHGHLIVATSDQDSDSIILEPGVRLRLACELANPSRQSEVGRNRSGPDGSTKTLWSRNMRSTADRSIPVVSFSVGSVPVDQTLNEDRPRIKAWFSGVDRKPPPTTVRASVILSSRRIRPAPRGRGWHSTPIFAIESTVILFVYFFNIYNVFIYSLHTPKT